MDINQIVTVLWHRKWILLAVIAIAIAGAFGALRVIEPPLPDLEVAAAG